MGGGRCKAGEDKVQEVGRQLEHQGGRRSPLPNPSCKPAGGWRAVDTRMEEPGGGWRWRLSTKTSVDKSLLVNFLFAFRDVPAECALVGCQLCRYQFFTRSAASKQHFLEGWGHHPTTNSS